MMKKKPRAHDAVHRILRNSFRNLAARHRLMQGYHPADRIQASAVAVDGLPFAKRCV
jgi:hypothetical protein